MNLSQRRLPLLAVPCAFAAVCAFAALAAATCVGAQVQTTPKSSVDRQTSGDAPANPGPLATGLSAKVDRHDIDRAMRKVADWQLSAAQSMFNRQWTYAALYDGLMAASRTTGDPKYAAAVANVGDEFDWKLIDTRFPHADDEALGQAYLDLYKIDSQPVRMVGTKDVMDRLAALSADPQKPVWWWCDALFMAPPVLVRMYVITHDSKYLETLDRHWWITSNLLYDPAEHLYFRDASYLQRTEKNGKPLFWARGNGWVLAGLANVLQYMPAGYPSRGKYLAQYREMANRIAQLQTPSGLWTTGLLDPESYPMAEVSGSAFYTYALAWGINHSILDPKVFRPVVERAWAGMISHIYADGRLGAIQPIGAAPDSFTASSSYVYGVGGFLLAGSELERLDSSARHHGK